MRCEIILYMFFNGQISSSLSEDTYLAEVELLYHRVCVCVCVCVKSFSRV